MADIVQFPKLQLVEPSEPEVNQVLVEILEETLAEAKSGKIIAAGICMVDDEYNVSNRFAPGEDAEALHDLITAGSLLMRRMLNFIETAVIDGVTMDEEE